MTFNLDVDNRPNKSGQYRIFIRITHNRKVIRKKTEVLISNKRHFKTSAKYGRWISSLESNAEKLNKSLSEILTNFKADFLRIELLRTEILSVINKLELLTSNINYLIQTPNPYISEQKQLLSTIQTLLNQTQKEYFSSLSSDSLELNIDLNETLKILNLRYTELQTAVNILKTKTNDYILGKSLYFRLFVENYVLNAVSLNKSPGYIRHVYSQANSFLSFAGNDIKLTEVSTSLINQYIIYLSQKETIRSDGSTSKLNNNTIIDKVQRIGMILKLAVAEDIISKNPVDLAKFPSRTPVNKKRLSETQIKAIELLQFDYSKQKYHYLAQKMFLFAMYNAGIRIGDTIQLRFNNIQNGRLVYQMGKTKHIKSILLSKKSMSIIEEMSQLVPNAPINCIFGLLREDQEYYPATNFEAKKTLDFAVKKRMYSDMDIAAAQIQRALKDIGTLINYPGNLTFHINRHSFGEKARRAVKAGKATIFDIKSALGHQKIETTMRYLDSLDVEGLDDAMSAIFAD